MIVIITGVSGSGLTTAINALNDSGFYCIDNLPIEMIIPTLESLNITNNSTFRGYAFGVHLHDLENVNKFVGMHKELGARGQLDVVFLTAESSELMTRYSTTRRPHPLLHQGGNFWQVITEEREILLPVEGLANIIIDTTGLPHHDLVVKIERRYSNGSLSRKLNVSLVSFGFKHGQYKPLDSLFDVRFLQNPYFVPELRKKTGIDKEVNDYIMSHEMAKECINRLANWHKWILPKYYEEGKHYFRIGVGCTGGKHRSVCIAEQLAKQIESFAFDYVIVNVSHRDIDLP
ncbi:MAG: RNase adapter RapZ [Bdellovibrionota bacterium]